MRAERWWPALALVGALACQAMLQPAQAQLPPGRAGGPQWHRQFRRWQQLPPPRRQAILREQQRYRDLPPAEQRRLYEQYRRARR